MTEQQTNRLSKHQNKKNTSGGSAVGGGINFQAAVSAIVSIHVARGTNLKWLDGIVNDIPVEWSAETGGAGDDIQVRFQDKSIAEVQVKKGLRADHRLWDTLIKLSKAIDDKSITYGVLVVCPNSSNPVRVDLAKDIVRLGDGRTDDLKTHAQSFQGKLQALGLPIEFICQRLRIVTTHALDHDSADIKAALSELEHLCADKSQVKSAWDKLYLDAEKLIKTKGRRTPDTIMRVFNSSDIALKTDTTAPLLVIKKITDSVLKTGGVFEIFGIDKAFSLDKAWIPLKTIIQIEPLATDKKLENLIKDYHSWDKREASRDAKELNPETIGRYFKHCVVVAGPGMGKSTLLKKLARVYSKDGFPVLYIRLSALAAQIKIGGSFEESIFTLGLDVSGIPLGDINQSRIQNWVILLDGLDESGRYQTQICEKLKSFVHSYPKARVIITTRPIGYSSSLLKEDWRHYELLPLSVNDAIDHIDTLLSDIYPPDSDELENALKLARTQLKNNKISHVIARSPFLLGLATSLFLRGKSLGKTKAELYESLFDLIDEVKPERVEPSDIASSTLIAFLNIIAWDLLLNPTDNLKSIKARCADVLSEELKEPKLKACQIVDDCLKYWEQVGMLEQLHFEGNTVITFIHKTFGEYAAARYLVDLQEEKQHKFIAEQLKNTPSFEAIAFAVSLGSENIIFAELLKNIKANETDAQILVKALDLLLVSEKKPKIEIIETLLDTSFEYIVRPTKQFNLDVAESILSLCEILPDKIFIRASKLLNHPQPWTKLAAWAFFVTTDKRKTYNFDQLLEVFKEISVIEKNITTSSRVFHLCLSTNPQTKLSEILIVFAIEEIILNLSEQEADSIIDDVLSPRFNDTTSFTIAVINVLSHYGKDKLAAPFKTAIERLTKPLGCRAKYEKHAEIANKKIFDCLNFNNDKLAVKDCNNPILFQLSAFFCGSSRSSSDARNWDYSFDMKVVTEVFRGMTGVIEIDTEKFAYEVQLALHEIEKGSFWLYGRTTLIDIEPSWAKAKALNLDVVKIEEALYHRSNWVVYIAANLLINIVDNSELINIITRVFDKGKDTALYVATQFSKRIDRVDLIEDRLQQPLNSNGQYQHLFQVLKSEDLVLDKKLLAIIENGLMTAGSLTATEAAEIAEKLANPTTKNLETILITAFKYWQKHEEPYPEGGGRVPKSPREKILKALLLINPPKSDTLFEYCLDTRSDIRNFATPLLMDQLCASSELRSIFLQKIVSEELKYQLLIAAFQHPVIFTEEQFNIIDKLISHKNSDIRQAIKGIFKQDNIPVKQRTDWQAKT